MTDTSAARRSGPQVMLLVLLTCLPGGSALVSFFGWGVVLNLAWLVVLAVTLEAVVLRLRGQPVLAQLRDCTALVTAIFLALALPPTAPWWLGCVAVFVAIVLAKHLYGGAGRNLLNPAMAGYAAVLLAFPLQMTRWLVPEGGAAGLPSFTEALLIFTGSDPDVGIDSFTGATVLDNFRQQRGGQLLSEFFASTPTMGRWAGLGWEWINAGFLVGGLYLLYRRVITWHIPGALLAALAAWALLFYDGGSSASGGSPLFHFFSGATMLGAFFIATDPVTAPATPRGKLLYGAVIGSLIYGIRTWSSYPDGVAFAVLFGNLAAPLLDAWAGPSARPVLSPAKSWNLTITVLLVAALASALTDLVSYVRRPNAERAALAAVMPAALYDNDLQAARFTIDREGFANVEQLGFTEPRQAYRASLNGQTSGVVLPLVARRGYGGPIELLVGIDAAGSVTGVRVVHHAETRGLADAIEPERSNWILGFDNRSLANTDEVLWAVKKDGGDFDQFVGATVTPRATVDAVHSALLFFEANQALLLSP